MPEKPGPCSPTERVAECAGAHIHHRHRGFSDAVDDLRAGTLAPRVWTTRNGIKL